MGGESYSPVSTQEYLGIALSQHRITSRELGLAFEKWVREANHVFNSFLETLQMEKLDAIPGALGRFYRTMAKRLLKVADHEACKKTLMAIDPQVSPYPSILDLTPDGVFADGSQGAIFESKLSLPNYPEFDYEIAAYAIGYEKSMQKDVDSTVILHSNYPAHERLSTLVRTIRDSTVGNISTNLERFILLIKSSQQGHTNMSKRFPHWKSFLARPKGLPELDQRGPCPSCKFRQQCYTDGGEP
jgi:hypothetical protein